jgi:hypothetical protein
MRLKLLCYLLSNDLQGSFIRHVDKPSCIHCIHYIPDLKETFTSGNCAMYGGKDLHTGIILYDDAHSVRQDESKCSVAGKYFVGEKNLLSKKINYHVQQNKYLMLGLITLVYGFIFNPSFCSDYTYVYE